MKELDEQLNRHANELAALQGALALLVAHLAKAGTIDKAAYITDLRYLVELPENEEPLRRAGHKLRRMIEVLH